MSPGTMLIRKCSSLDEMSACVALQKEVWNFTDAELVPLRMFVIAEKVGGQVIGAFDEGKMVAFALAVPGIVATSSVISSQSSERLFFFSTRRNVCRCTLAHHDFFVH